MAQTKKVSRSSFYEVVFQGKPKVVRAFLSGLVMGSGKKAKLFYSFVEGVHHEGKAEMIKEMVGIRATDCHVIVDAETSAMLKKLGKKIESETALVVRSHRNIRMASMKFSYKAFAAPYHEEITDVIMNLPDGLRMRGYKQDVKVDPEHKGVEAYASVHHFEASGQGTIFGGIDQMIDLRRKMDKYPLIDTEEIQLKLA